MARTYDSIDLWWTDEADFHLSGEGDIDDTSSDLLRSVEQEMRSRIRSSPGDWLVDVELGAGLDDYVGEVNSKALAREIRLQIINALTQGGLVSAADLSVRAMPIDAHTIVFRLGLKANSVTDRSEVAVQLLYDTNWNGLEVL